MADIQLSSRAARVEDYLNDKLQTTADLEGLDILLENVQTQQELLKQQVAHVLSMIEYLLICDQAPRSRERSRRNYQGLRSTFLCSPTASSHIQETTSRR